MVCAVPPTVNVVANMALFIRITKSHLMGNACRLANIDSLISSRPSVDNGHIACFFGNGWLDH